MMPYTPQTTFEQAWEYADKIFGWYSVTDARALWDVGLECLGQYGILEVGCLCGRSTAILAHLLKGTGLSLTLIEPFIDYWNGAECSIRDSHRPALLDKLVEIGTPFRLIEKRTCDIASEELPSAIDLLHIDGDHRKAGIGTDCERLLPLVRLGGFACFHDYVGIWSSEVHGVVDEFTPGWEVRGTLDVLRVLKK